MDGDAIFLKIQGELMLLNKAPYETEDVLQRALASIRRCWLALRRLVETPENCFSSGGRWAFLGPQMVRECGHWTTYSSTVRVSR